MTAEAYIQSALEHLKTTPKSRFCLSQVLRAMTRGPWPVVMIFLTGFVDQSWGQKMISFLLLAMFMTLAKSNPLVQIFWFPSIPGLFWIIFVVNIILYLYIIV